MAKNLIKRNEIWHVRIAIPKDVRHIFNGKREIQKSLKTRKKSTAEMLKLEYLIEIKKKIEEEREKATMACFELDKNESFIFIKSALNEMLIASKKRRNKEIVDEIISKNKRITLSEVTDIMCELEDKIEEKFDKSEDKYHENMKKLDLFHDNIKENLNENNELNAEKVKELYTLKHVLPVDLMKDELLKEFQRDKNKELVEKATKLINESYGNKDFITTKIEFTDSRIKKYKKFLIEVKELKDRTIDSMLSKIQHFNSFIKKENLDLNFHNVVKYIDSMSDKTAKTQQQYLLACSSIYKYLFKYDKDFIKKFKKEQNPFLNHELSFKSRSMSYKALDKSDVVKLLKKSEEKGYYDVRDMILIGMYTGCRIEEVCRLDKNSIIIEDGVKCFDIDESKTDAGIRKTPVHKDLEEHIDRMIKESKDGYLIKSNSKNKYNRRSDNLSKKFGRMKKAMGFGGEHTFHSFRKTVITTLERLDCPRYTLKAIVGHERGDVTYDVYSAGPTPKIKKKYLDMLSYEYD